MLSQYKVATASVRCKHCGQDLSLISQALGVCVNCIRHDFAKVSPFIRQAHHKARKPFALPDQPPQDEAGAECKLCINQCNIPPDGISYCGLRTNEGGKLSGATADLANVSWYYDPLPTNCVASWVCPAGTGVGYPDFAYCQEAEYGYKNLAVFYQACSFDCLFCQNWHFRYLSRKEDRVSAAKLAREVDKYTACVCYFGGDPTPKLPHSIRASRLMRAQNKNRILRICWETNGSMHPALLKSMVELSLSSGGCIKFDLKAWDEGLHIALCGVSNKRTLENFHLLGQYIPQRPSPPFLVASTLLVPGYVDEEEVGNIATFVAAISPDIPYVLLAFHPQFMMADLPTTSQRHAQMCLEVARAKGLNKVRIGNLHLLGAAY